MKKVFNDSHLDEKFKKDGYLLIPLNNRLDVQSLKSKLLELKPSDNYCGKQDSLIGAKSFHVTFFDSNVDYKQSVFSIIAESLRSVVKELLNEYKCAQANVFIKPTQTGLVSPHQNLTIVDEEQYTSVSFWIPLQDTTFENGTVCVIPASQHYFNKYRNTNILWPYIDFFTTECGKNFFTTIDVKAGDLLVLDDRIVHYTPQNNSASDRWVVHSLWAPKEAHIKYYSPHSEIVDEYDVEDNFWQLHSPGNSIEHFVSKVSKVNQEHIYTESELIVLLTRLKGIYTQ